MSADPRARALLVLADGEVFEGEAAGAAQPVSTGELVFNTALSGYQEVLTDPSYAGQVVAFTYPHIGNYGVNGEDDESPRVHCRGVVVRDLSPEPSSWRASESLEGWLLRMGVPAVSGIDTRRLTRHLRDKGAMPCAFGTAGEATLRDAAAQALPTDGRDLVSEVTTAAPFVRGDGPRRVVAYDFGVKETMLRHLGRLATVTVVPASTPASDVLSLEPDGVFLSNGPGDPEPCDYAIAAIREFLARRVPLFGICLGHQLLGLAAGGRTLKMKFGHHGANHPVQELASGRVLITSQNHGFAVDEATLPAHVRVTHRSLFDGSNQGIELIDAPAFGFQGHPEASPGPHDVSGLFDRFIDMMRDSGLGTRDSGGAR